MKGTDEITNSEDIIDSRDVIARIEYLESDFDSLKSNVADAETEEEKTEAREKLADWLGCTADDLPEDVETIDLKDASADEARELKALRALAEQCEGYGDWNHGEALIRDSYFQCYAEQFADDIGAIDSNATWPLCHIDWEAAADSLKQDYTSVDFDGETYWMRS